MIRIDFYRKREKLSRSAWRFRLYKKSATPGNLDPQRFRATNRNRLALLSVVVSVIVQTADHSKGKHIGLVFRIRPKNVMTHLMINGVNPLSF
jgi:hypothetical protein